MSTYDGKTPRWFWFFVVGMAAAIALFVGGVFALVELQDRSRARVAAYAAGVAERMSPRFVSTPIAPRAHSLRPAYAVYFIGGPGREAISQPSEEYPNLIRTSAGPLATEADVRTLAFVRTELHESAGPTYTLHVWVVDGTTGEVVRFSRFPPPDNAGETNRPTFIVLVYDWLEQLLREN